MTHPRFEHNDFDQCSLSTSTVRASKKVQLIGSLIGIRQRTFQRAIDEVYVDLYSAFLRKAPLMRSDMDHSFTCKLHHACLYSPAAEHHRPLASTHFTVPRRVEG